MSTSPLPAPTDLPDADVVIFDGQCQFCQRQVARLRRLDGGQRLAFLSLHDPTVKEYCGSLTHEQMMEQMYVVNRAGERFGGAAAFRYLTRRLPKLWLLAPLLHLPLSLPVWRWLYGQVAKRRYRWNKPACDGTTCRVHFGKR